MTVRVNGRTIEVHPNTTVAVAIAVTDVPGFAPLCAMGTCYQCRATIDGVTYRRTCLELCRDGMEVRTDGV